MNSKPFWDISCWAISSTLWNPNGKHKVKKAHKGFSKSLRDSWFHYEIKSQSNRIKPLCDKLTECREHKKYKVTLNSEPIYRVKRIRLYTHGAQKQLIKQWFGAHRTAYNSAIAKFKEYKEKGIKIIKESDLRREIITEMDTKEFFKNIPYEIKAGAIKDAMEARKRAIEKFKKYGDISNFKFKTKKSKNDSITIRARAVSQQKNGIYLYKTYSKKYGKFSFAEELPSKGCFGDGKLSFKDGLYYLCLPVERKSFESGDEIQVEEKQMVAIDPGVRTPITFYSPELIGKLGNGDYKRITSLCLYLDKMISKATKVNHRTRKGLKRVQMRIRKRIRNLVDEFHKKAAKFLCDNFKVIFLPEYGVKKMVNKSHRNISSGTARSMLSWSPYRFRERLQYKAKESGVAVHIVTEEYTSKTCTTCGSINYTLGRSEIFKCKCCPSNIDRDINGARNIWLKSFRSIRNLERFG